ncbi:MAG: C13 family peptidase [Pseudomonadota bacterium]
MRSGLLLLMIAPALWAGTTLPTFDLLWPSQPRPYFFQTNFATGPNSVALDDQGFVYVSDPIASQIQKYSSDGVLVSNIDSPDLFSPHGVAVDSQGNVIVTDRSVGYVIKFSPDGEQLARVGGLSGADGEFTPRCIPCGSFLQGPFQLAVDDADNYYVLDPPGYRVVKFNSDLQFVANFGAEGTGPGQFTELGPIGIAHLNGEIFVSSFNTELINVFSTEGTFVRAIDGLGSGLNTIVRPEGLGLDGEGNLLVTAASRVVRIDAAGNQLLEFGTFDNNDASLGPGELAGPRQALAGSNGTAYVVDRYGITRWGRDNGEFLSRWSDAGEELGKFASPDSMAISSSGDVYVAGAFNRRIQVFDADGIFLRSFAPVRPGESDTGFLGGMAIASDGSVVIVTFNQDEIIRRFSANGEYLNGWGRRTQDLSEAGVDGVFGNAVSIAVGPDDLVYVGDEQVPTIQVFELDGTFVGAISDTSSAQPPTFYDAVTVAPDGTVLAASLRQLQRFTPEGQLLAEYALTERTFSLAVDDSGRIYAGDTRLEVLAADGTPLGVMAEGGVLPGQVNTVRGLAIGSGQRVYALERSNNRMQRFRPGVSAGNTKAIVVTGGGPYPGNALWDATQVNANFVYRTLVSQGFQKDTIQYLSADTDLDLDQNGVADDVDSDATNASFEAAITGSFADDADNLLIYMVDHGGVDTFRMSGSEVLQSATLDGWLSAWQATHPDGELTVIYDACESGSFMDDLAGTNRLVITSASPGESAYFVSGGTMSFSNQFWTQVFNGEDVGEAFTVARDSTFDSFPTQNALIDSDGDGEVNEPEDLQIATTRIIGRGLSNAVDRPVLGTVTAPAVLSSGNTAEISVSNVFDSNGIARVWSVVRPPGFQPGSSDNPVAELPLVEFVPTDSNGTYGATPSLFNSPGTYELAVYAEDEEGNVGVPRLASITVDDPSRRRAVLIVGTRADGSRRRPFERNGNLAQAALRQQGYGPDGSRCRATDCDDIFYLSPVSSFGTDGLSTLANVQEAITAWGTDGVSDLTVYLVGAQNNGDFVLNDTETLSAQTLEGWLDEVEASNGGQLTVVYDGSNAGAFLPVLASNATNPRIVITSTDAGEEAVFRRRGRLAYSRFFWTSQLNGANVRRSHQLARSAVRFSGEGQNAQLDDQGNAAGNELFDGARARFYALGRGILLAGDEPVIGGVAVASALTADFEPITASGVTTTGRIDEVFAVITRPDGQAVLEPMTPSGDDFQAGSVGLCAGAGSYEISVFAADDEGKTSQASSASTTRSTPCADTSFDLVVQDVEVPATVLAADAEAETIIRATNVGPATVADSTIRVYLSEDSTFDGSDPELAAAQVDNLFSFAEAEAEFVVPLPTSESVRFLIACIDPVGGEADMDNNCAAPARIKIATEDLVFSGSFE